jgi:hypothetical protein
VGCADFLAYVRVWDEPQRCTNLQRQEIDTDGRAAVVRTTGCRSR